MNFLQEYLVIFIALILAVILAIVVFSLSYILVLRQSDTEKLSAYECGFDPFSDARTRFDVRFYLVAILFIIFDLEIVYLFPWVVALRAIGGLGFWSMMLFLFILTVGFVYEWSKGALNWE
jgi:NADH:ubiquinone oxidoreductase subunit 3 (subunit A)